MNALQASKVCDITGLVDIACARHGCYAPQALVDLFKGEQQKNIDFALLKALSSTKVDPEQGVLLIYDIACQYFVHLQDRIGSQLPSGLNIDAAIGLFHVHAHKEQCFFQYAMSFIPGAGIVAGEILESLWSTLNSISPTARTATLAHRAEMLDDHASDSNHKKTLGIIPGLCRSHRTAVDMLEHAKTYYQNLTDQADKTIVEKWTHDIEAAESNRKFDITAMNIYAAKSEHNMPGHRHPASGMPDTPIALWMVLSLSVEEKQYVTVSVCTY
jgi:KDZ transposase-like protein